MLIRKEWTSFQTLNRVDDEEKFSSQKNSTGRESFKVENKRSVPVGSTVDQTLRGGCDNQMVPP